MRVRVCVLVVGRVEIFGSLVVESELGWQQTVYFARLQDLCWVCVALVEGGQRRTGKDERTKKPSDQQRRDNKTRQDKRREEKIREEKRRGMSRYDSVCYCSVDMIVV